MTRAASIPSRAWLEVTVLHRTLTPWLACFFVVWVVLLRVQEPGFARPHGGGRIPFYWAGIESTLLLALGGLPLAWLLLGGREQHRWTARLARSSWTLATGAWLAICVYGALITIGVAAFSFTVDRMFGSSPGWRLPAGLLIQSACVLGPAAALAPAVAALRLPAAGLVSVWLAILTISWIWALPLPTRGLLVLNDLQPDLRPLPDLRAGFSSMQATLGGLLLSLAVIERRSHG